ncbi:conserved hypothetical protein, partial [Ricinus communis]
MGFTPNILRLDACLCAAGTQLQSTDLVAADALLAVQTAPGNLHALKHAAHHLRQLLREQNHLIKQSLAFEALARYLGHPDWNTARKLLLARESSQKPTAIGGSAWLYVFEIFDKSSGVADIVSGLNLVGKRLRDVARLRLISCPDSPPEGVHVLNQWRSPGSASLSIADALNDSRRCWLGSAISQGLPAFGLVQGLCMLRHFIYVELKEPVAGMRRSYRTISGELERVFRCQLRMPALDSLGAFGNMQVLPEGFLQWAHAASAVPDNSWLTTQAVPCATVFDFEWTSATPRLVRYGVGLPGTSATSETNANVQQWVQTLTAKGVTLSQGGLASVSHADFAPLLAGSWLAEGKLANPSTGVPVASRAGDLTFLDLWATCEPKGRPPFFLVSAMSGSGKSFLANELIVDALSNHRNVRSWTAVKAMPSSQTFSTRKYLWRADSS